ncbi:MAG: protein phosphatase 2C domain-containing protein [Candidatus Obscuribacterales bacterium]|nr:protein phosphatase 2C domain-containing protein [Candidatus Obscuribacterales bacterium]
MVNLTWKSAGVTDVGLKRKDNQDNFYISEDGRCLVVCDGVGGETGGALASRLAVETVETLWLSEKPDMADVAAVEAWMRRAVAEANTSVKQAADASEDKKTMGTTIVMAVFGEEGLLHVAHAGDSRTTLVRDGKAEVLTVDHSVVMEMHLRGQLTLEQCAVNPYRNLITRCLGHEENVEVDYSTKQLQDKDWIILCTDGLSEVVKPDELGPTVSNHTDPQEACAELLQMVLDRNAPDNVTIIAVEYQQVEAQVPTTADSK